MHFRIILKHCYRAVLRAFFDIMLSNIVNNKKIRDFKSELDINIICRKLSLVPAKCYNLQFFKTNIFYIIYKIDLRVHNKLVA